jgi:hypothetical protein
MFGVSVEASVKLMYRAILVKDRSFDSDAFRLPLSTRARPERVGSK